MNEGQERNSKLRTLETSPPPLEHPLHTYAQDVIRCYQDMFELGDMCKVTCEGYSLPQPHKSKTTLTVLSCIPQLPKMVCECL